MSGTVSSSLADQIGATLPFLRRHVRALTGSQSAVDTYAATIQEAILSNPTLMNEVENKTVALSKVFHSIWKITGAPLSNEEFGLAAEAQKHLSRLTGNSREALLLHTVEEFSVTDVATIIGVELKHAQKLIDLAHAAMTQSLSGKIMIIEDEAIIALDLEGIVADLGHPITGIARTESGTLDLFKREKPDLILSDIQLADGSSGIDAVNEILEGVREAPLIYITTFPRNCSQAQGRNRLF